MKECKCQTSCCGEKHEEHDSEDDIDEDTKGLVEDRILKRIDDLVTQCNGLTYEERIHGKEVLDGFKDGSKNVNIKAAHFSYCILKRFYTIMNRCFKQEEDATYSKASLRDFISYSQQLPWVARNFFYSLSDDEDSIVYKDLDHEDWKLLFDHYEYADPVSLEGVVEASNTLAGYLGFAASIMTRKDYGHLSFLRKMYRGAKWAAYYAIYKEKSKQQYNLWISNPDTENCLRLYNGVDTPSFQDAMQILYTRVKVHKLIYLPMLLKDFTIDQIGDVVKSFGEEAKLDINDLANEELKDGTNFQRLDRENYEKDKFVMVRVLSDIGLPVDWDDCSLKSTDPVEIPAIIVHYHGGGFIAGSSGSHQTYSREWAKKAKIPVFSVDYRLSPEYAYSAGLNDCFQVYYWIVTQCESRLGIKPKKIFLAGDSAGGNLVYGVTNLSILTGIRVPDMINLFYPCMTVDNNRFTPSQYLAVSDKILPTGFIEVFTKCYLDKEGKCRPDSDFLMSPALTPDTVLAHYPKVRLLVSGSDAFRDESYKYALRLLKQGKDLKFVEYQTFPHGFLQLDSPVGGVAGFEKPILKSIEFFEEEANSE